MRNGRSQTKLLPLTRQKALPALDGSSRVCGRSRAMCRTSPSWPRTDDNGIRPPAQQDRKGGPPAQRDPPGNLKGMSIAIAPADFELDGLTGVTRAQEILEREVSGVLSTGAARRDRSGRPSGVGGVRRYRVGDGRIAALSGTNVILPP